MSLFSSIANQIVDTGPPEYEWVYITVYNSEPTVDEIFYSQEATSQASAEYFLDFYHDPNDYPGQTVAVSDYFSYYVFESMEQ